MSMTHPSVPSYTRYRERIKAAWSRSRWGEDIFGTGTILVELLSKREVGMFNVGESNTTRLQWRGNIILMQA